jgi:adenosylhomocysteine nucleosidase
MDLTAFGRRHGELPGTDRMIESDPDMVQHAAEAFDAAFPDSASAPSLMLGTVVSGDRFIQDPDELRWLQREFSALATEMEGAAVGYTSDLNGVPFVVIRGLSDASDDSASADFASNLPTVCDNCFRVLQALIPAVGASVTKCVAEPVARDCRAAG